MNQADSLLHFLFSGFGWVGLIAFFLHLAARRTAGARFRRFAILAATAVLWVFGSALQTLLFEQDPLSGIVGTLICAGPYLIYCLHFYRRLHQETPRQRIVRHDFLRALLFSILVGPGIEIAAVLSAPYWSAANELRAWGPIVGTVPIVVPGFMLTVNPIMNVRRVALRAFLYIAFCFAGALGLFLVIGWRGFDPLAPRWYLYLLFWIVAGTVTGLAWLHTRYLKITMEYLFLRDVYRKEQELQKFVNEVQTLDSARESQEIVQELILQNLFGVFRMKKGFIVSVNRTGDLFVRYLGEAERGTQEFQQYRPFMRRRLPENFLEEIDQVFLLEDGVPLPFQETPERYDRVAGRIRDTAADLCEAGYEIFMPLIFRGEIWGLIFLGAKDTPYYNGERILLNNARTGYAQALRNRAVLEEIKTAHMVEPADPEGQADGVPTPMLAPVEVQRLRLGQRSLVYADPGMHTLVKKARQIAASYLPVLIQGETGTGKELIARLLHQAGPGASAPFVAVNCAAIPASLWESEIFGYKKGAFTGAGADSPGLVEQAAGGLLFFDEIGEMPLEIQPKILRLIQEKSYRPVGGKKNQEAACRPIFATHRDLAAMSRAGEFREDLYYRINVHRVAVPALRERRADIPLILEQLMEQHAGEPFMAPDEEGNPRVLAPETLALLRDYPWPGNIRELENVFVRCLVESSSHVIQPVDLPVEIREGRGVPPSGDGTPPIGEPDTDNFEKSMNDYARLLIQRALSSSGGNQSKAARQLGISRGKLIYRMKELGIEA